MENVKLSLIDDKEEVKGLNQNGGSLMFASSHRATSSFTTFQCGCSLNCSTTIWLRCFAMLLILAFMVLFLWSNTSKFINKSLPLIPELRIPEDNFLQFAVGLRNELNQGPDAQRNIASGRDLKKFTLSNESRYNTTVILLFFVVAVLDISFVF